MQNYITLKEVSRRTGGRSRSSIYLDIAAGRLPKPLKLGGRVYFPEDELEAHYQSLADAQRSDQDAPVKIKSR
mgnify:CR=1 FL=1